MRTPTPTTPAVVRLGLVVGLAGGGSGCGATVRPAVERDAQPAAWTALAARVHAGGADAVAAELRHACARGSGAECSALADLIELRFVPADDRESARDLYILACGRAHELACVTLEQGVTWLTLPLLQVRHADAPRLAHERERAGPEALRVDVCFDADGVPVRVHLRGSTGRDADDHRLSRAASEWRFEPLAVTEPRTMAACARFLVAL